MHHLIWFRNDLRIHDNPALHHACSHKGRVSALYVDCPVQWQHHDMSAIQREFIARNLQALEQSLAALGIPLIRAHADEFAQLPDKMQAWVREHGIDAIYANRERGINERRRDQAVAEQLTIPLKLFNGDCVVPPGRLKTASDEMYRVFTPFSRAWLDYLRHNGYRRLPTPAPRGPALPLPAQATDNTIPGTAWSAGETAARQQLQRFCNENLPEYGEKRDFPDRPGTSLLSPYLAIGILSPNQCLAAVEEAVGHLPFSRGEAGFSWVNELIWREFYRHLIVAYPRLSMGRAFKADTEKLRWSEDKALFRRWCEGQTGYPIVDAAMRCLNQTGWMHNRLRMIVASFLTKDLHIHWRWGERYFMSRLIDGDQPSNNGGWQWTAGTGADAAPYFRVFNPTTQGQRFDPEGAFTRQWLPELADVPSKQIHTPHAWLQQHGRSHVYPPPIVNHDEARKHAIAMFEALKNNDYP